MRSTHPAIQCVARYREILCDGIRILRRNLRGTFKWPTPSSVLRVVCCCCARLFSMKTVLITYHAGSFCNVCSSSANVGAACSAIHDRNGLNEQIIGVSRWKCVSSCITVMCRNEVGTSIRFESACVRRFLAFARILAIYR